MVGQKLFGCLYGPGVEAGPGELVHGPFHDRYLGRRHLALALQLGQLGQLRLQLLSEHGAAGPDGRCGPHPGRCFAGGEVQYPHQKPGHVGEAMAAGKITGFRGGNQTMINDGKLVAEGFEAVPHCELCGGIKLIKPTGFDSGDQIGESVVEGVEGRIQRRRVSA
jgi:hypothetical protein